MTGEPKTLSLKSPILGYGRISFGKDKEVLEENIKKHTFFIKFLGNEPENIGEEIKIFTFGVFFLAGAGGMRLGFIKRHQILARA